MQALVQILTVYLCLSLFSALHIPLKTTLHSPIGADPEDKMNVMQILAYWHYPGESHNVITPDGYNLTIHRIPHANSSKGVVFLQHCLLCSSADFLLNLPNESLAFILADEGYDVWMGKLAAVSLWEQIMCQVCYWRMWDSSLLFIHR